MIRHLTYALMAMACLASPLHAQDDEESGGFLVDLLQNNLSGENRNIKVTGLEGALSSQATLQKLTVSDDEGVWLTITDAVLDWNRLALIRGRFSINTLSAGEIIVARAPNPVAGTADLPEPEAAPFQLPELPVSIEIGELKVERLELGEPLVGIAAELGIAGTFSLADGSLDTALGISRLDRPTDELDLKAGFQNATRQITLDLTLTEDKGGLVSELLSIPDRPTVLLTAKGEGPLDDFTADITLASDGVERIDGRVQLQKTADPDADAAPGIGFSADIGGDIAPLLAQEYRAFFGSDTQLSLNGLSGADGRLLIEHFDVLSDALMLNGTLDIAGTGHLERANLDGRISPPDGEEVVLPIGEPRTAIKDAVITAQFEAAKDNTWLVSLGVNDLNRPDLQASRIQLRANGQLVYRSGMVLDGQVNAAIRGLGFADPALADAVGSDLVLKGDFQAEENSVLKLSNFVMTGADYEATVDAEIDGLESGFHVDGTSVLALSDLSRFSALAGQDLGGAISGQITGKGSPLGGMFDIDLKVDATDLQSGIAQIDPLISGDSTLRLLADRDEDGLDIKSFKLSGTALSAEASGSVRSGATDIEFNAGLDDLARVAPQVSGPVTIKGDVTQTEAAITGKVHTTGPLQSVADFEGSLAADGDIDLSYDAVLGTIEEFIPQLVGAIQAKGVAKRVDNAWQVTSDIEGPSGSFAQLQGSMTADSTIDGRYDATITRIERFVPQLKGSLDAKGTAKRKDNAWQIASDVNGPSGSKAELQGSMAADGTIDARYDAVIARIERFVPQVKGALKAEGTATRVQNAWQVASNVNGPSGSTAQLHGSMATDGTIDATYDATIARLERFVPELAGSLKANGTAKRADEAWSVESDVNGPSGSTLQLDASMTPEGAIDATYDASLVRLERFVPEFPGTVTAKGTARRDNDLWSINSNATGPGQLAAQISGTVNQSTLVSDVTAKGQMQLAIANRFIKPNSVRGTGKFDLALKGEPKIESLSGRITTAGSTVAIPSVTQAIDNLDAQISLANGSANLSVSAGVRAGGKLQITGPVSLTPPFKASIVTEILELGLTDNVTFESSANGRIAFTGALAGRGQLAGDIRFGETNININAMSGSISAAPIPPIQHVGETAAAQATRDHAGLVATAKKGEGPDIGLDIRLIAENKVFVRGRGLQAELGGNILVRGTVAQVAPSGQINLIRGNLDLLGRRLKLSKGLVTLQGELEPYMEFAATTSTSDGDATLEISGPVTKPTVKVFSQPERPSEEALAMLIFGNQYSELSPIKIAQLAASLATLSGAGGNTGEKAREGLGVDTVDIGSDESGNAQFGAGKYLADGVYTDITVNTQGDTELNLNLDLSESLTVKGSVDRQGDTGIGLFFERDY